MCDSIEQQENGGITRTGFDDARLRLRSMLQEGSTQDAAASPGVRFCGQGEVGLSKGKMRL